MTHIEIPVASRHHLTLVHFSRTLTAPEGQIALEGMEALAKAYAGLPLNMYWGFPIMVGPPSNQRKASGVEFETDLVPNLQQRLSTGLASRGLPVSRDFGAWLPHVTDPPFDLPETWCYLKHHGKMTLVQKPHRVDVDFPVT